jgi:uncharacterized membrane protein YsdA (DUF1294 family)
LKNHVIITRTRALVAFVHCSARDKHSAEQGARRIHQEHAGLIDHISGILGTFVRVQGSVDVCVCM